MGKCNFSPKRAYLLEIKRFRLRFLNILAVFGPITTGIRLWIERFRRWFNKSEVQRGVPAQNALVPLQRDWNLAWRLLMTRRVCCRSQNTTSCRCHCMMITFTNTITPPTLSLTSLLLLLVLCLVSRGIVFRVLRHMSVQLLLLSDEVRRLLGVDILEHLPQRRLGARLRNGQCRQH